MWTRRSAVLLLAASVLASTPAWAHAQGKFGKPVALEEARKQPDEFGLAPPTREQLFRVQSEESLKERLRQEMPKVKNMDFPKDARRPEVTAEAPSFVAQVVSPVSGQVCYRPLYFEDKRTERFGQYVPCVQPLLSLERFYRDFVMLPWRLYLTPPWTYECDNR